ncbi:MAG: hypothetical protein ACE5E5_11085 [Phycisphaerae bacterium]
MKAKSLRRWMGGLMGWMCLPIAIGLPHALPRVAKAQSEIQVEDFEFAISDAAAAAGVIDRTDVANQPAFYINGQCDIPPSPCAEVAEGEFALGTDAAFCQQFCQAGSRIGFRRLVDPVRFPDTCAGGGHFVPLDATFGDPDHPGAVAPDFPLSELQVICSAYGDGSYQDGPTGTHFWVTLVDCEGEVFEYINFSEPALYTDLYTFDLAMGRSIIRLSPDSLVNGQPAGDGLLTEIAAIESFIQDADDPPTSFGKWYIDDVRIIQPPPPPPPPLVPAVSTWGMIILVQLMLGAGTLVFGKSAAR